MTQYPEVQALVDAVREFGLSLSVEPATPELDAMSYRRIRFAAGDGRVAIIPVDDEYGDAASDSPELLLHLVQRVLQVVQGLAGLARLIALQALGAAVELLGQLV